MAKDFESWWRPIRAAFENAPNSAEAKAIFDQIVQGAWDGGITLARAKLDDELDPPERIGEGIDKILMSCLTPEGRRQVEEYKAAMEKTLRDLERRGRL